MYGSPRIPNDRDSPFSGDANTKHSIKHSATTAASAKRFLFVKNKTFGTSRIRKRLESIVAALPQS
jgi:hypothetical protein